MEFLRFYGLVVRETFRHSLDIAQAIIFGAVLFAGLIVYENPSIKPKIEAFDLAGWKSAVLVFVGIIAVRLVFAPFWLWKAAISRTVERPEQTIDFKFAVTSFANRNDVKNKAIQIIFVLTNSSVFHTIQYQVEEIYVEVEGKTAENPAFLNHGGTVPANAFTHFDFPWIDLKPRKKWISPGTTGHASIVLKYGIAGRAPSRRIRFAAPFIIEKTHIRHNPTEQRDEPI